MAGKARGRRFVDRLAGLGGLEWMLEEISEGRSLRSIAREIGCSRWWLDRWIHADAERKVAVTRARVAGADALVDLATEIVDGLGPESTVADVKAADLRVRQLRWLAGKMDQA